MGGHGDGGASLRRADPSTGQNALERHDAPNLETREAKEARKTIAAPERPCLPDRRPFRRAAPPSPWPAKGVVDGLWRLYGNVAFYELIGRLRPAWTREERRSL